MPEPHHTHHYTDLQFFIDVYLIDHATYTHDEKFDGVFENVTTVDRLGLTTVHRYVREGEEGGFSWRRYNYTYIY